MHPTSLDRHLRIGPGLGQGRAQGHRVVLDAEDFELLAVFILSDDE
jgi:hypothetical protein